MKKSLTIIALLVATVTVANAVVLLNEPFNVDGTMGTTPYASWTSISGTGDQLLVNSTTGLAFGPSDRDYSQTYTAEAGTVFAGFDLTVSTLPASGTEYIMAFADGTGFDGRIFVSSISSGANFSLGVSIASNTASLAPATLNLNTTYRVLSSYSPTTDSISLWVGTYNENAPAVSTTGTDGSTVSNAFVIRQAGAFDNGASALSIQNLTVATSFTEVIPEPSTYLLLGIGAAFMIWNLRRRRVAKA